MADVKATVELPNPVIRITLLGRRGSGKTRLVDSFLNQTPESECWPLDPTVESELYYRLHFIKDPNREQKVSVLVELEDTPGSTLSEAAANPNTLLEDVMFSEEEMSVLKYVSGTYSAPVVVPREVKVISPLNIFDNPWLTKPDYDAESSRIPGITPHRMAYVIVFDGRDRESLDEAIKIHRLLKTYKTRRDSSTALIVTLVATRSELQETDEVVRLGEAYCTRNRLPFYNVSAARGVNVSKLFGEICSTLINTPIAFKEVACFSGAPAGVSDDDDDSGDEPNNVEQAIRAANAI